MAGTPFTKVKKSVKKAIDKTASARQEAKGLEQLPAKTSRPSSQIDFFKINKKNLGKLPRSTA